MQAPLVFGAKCFRSGSLKNLGARCWAQNLHFRKKLRVVSSFLIVCHCTRDGVYGKSVSYSLSYPFQHSYFLFAQYVEISYLVSWIFLRGNFLANSCRFGCVRGRMWIQKSPMSLPWAGAPNWLHFAWWILIKITHWIISVALKVSCFY